MTERPYVDRRVADESRARGAAEVAADRWGLGPVDLLRHGMNAIFRVASRPGVETVVLRVADPTAPAECSLELADTMLTRGVPVLRPARDDVVRHDGLSVSAWDHVEAVGPVDWREVGAALRRVHDVGVDELPTGLPTPQPTAFPWWHFSEMLDGLGDELDVDARRGIDGAIERHVGWDDFADPASSGGVDTVVCHGDVHPGNVIQSADGPVLIDWDLLCRAPAGWDHAPLMTWEERWGGDPAVYDRLAEGYGWSGRGDRHAEAFAELRLVAATLMRLRAGLTDPDAMPEARRRLRHWRGEPDAPVWRAV